MINKILNKNLNEARYTYQFLVRATFPNDNDWVFHHDAETLWC